MIVSKYRSREPRPGHGGERGYVLLALLLGASLLVIAAGTATLSVGSASFNLAFYVVSANEVILASTGTPSAANPIVGGEAIASVGPFSALSLQKTHMFHTAGFAPTGPDGNIGILSFDGVSSVSGTQYEDQAATIGTTSLSGSYTVDAKTGRFAFVPSTTNAQSLGDHQLVGYVIPVSSTLTRQNCKVLADCVTGFLVSTDQTAQAGLLEFQTPSIAPPPPFSAVYVEGYYFYGTDEGLDSATPLIDGASVANPTGTVYGGVQSTNFSSNSFYCQQEPGCVLLHPNEAISPSAAYSVSSNGTGTVGGETVAVTNGNVIFYIDEFPINAHPSVIVVEQWRWRPIWTRGSPVMIAMRSRAWQSLFWFLALAAITAATPVTLAASQENASDNPGRYSVCSSLGEYIFVGGTAGFDALHYGDLFPELLKTGHVGLYQHANAINAAEEVPGLLTLIEQVFAGTGSGEAELGQVGWNYFTLPPSYRYYQEQYIENGLHPSEANVDTPSDSAAPGQLVEDLRQWREYVDAARIAGIESVAPIAGPNDPSEPKLGDEVFATNPYYELEREEALYGKAIAFDVPPHFFLTGGSGPGYEKFIVQAIQWGNDHGLRTTVLLSPYPWPTNAAGQLETFDQFTGNTFSQDTRDFVRLLTEDHAVPSEWAVDNYEDTYPNDHPAMVPETVLNTTTEVGLWLARNAPVYSHGRNTDGVICPAPFISGAR